VPAPAIVYDCMDAPRFLGAAPERRECALLAQADVVFTGGYSLYEATRRLHRSVHAFPSSVDVDHFARARRARRDPADQHHIGRPRIGFCGAIDDRMDLDLLRQVAAAQPDWQFVLIGPVATIGEAALPRAANLHYLGQKRDEELPAYLSGWDVAMLPFAHNDATRFISPSETPQYLAAGCPVVSTSIRDVVTPYGEHGLVRIADAPDGFAAAIAAAIADGRRSAERADALLATMSWDRTWAAMNALIEQIEPRTDAADGRRPVRAARVPPHIDAATA
jgi:UDP-galactopyranose mutase